MPEAAIFLDRDGTLIREVGYPNDPSQVELLPGAGAALAEFARAGYRIVVATNQSGIARGLLTEEDLKRLHREVNRQLQPWGTAVDRFYACPHLPDPDQVARPELAVECDCRKPGPGLLRRAAEELGIDLAASWMVGDTWRDIAAGQAAGCRTIKLPAGPAHDAPCPFGLSPPTAEAPDLLAAARFILGTAPERLDPTTIAVALPNWVGDVVMATPTLRALRRRFPGRRILAVGRPYVRPVLEPSPWFDAYIEFEASRSSLRRTAAALRAEGVRVGILLPNSLRSALLFRLAGVGRRIGYARDGRSWLLTDRLTAPRHGGKYLPTPQITYYLALAGVLGADISDLRMELPVTDTDDVAAVLAFRAAGLDPDATVLLCPGYSFGPSKAWPVGHWAATARGIVERLGLRPAVLGGPADAGIAAAITTLVPACASLAGPEMTLATARAVVRRARVVVCLDSGLRHFAAAFDRPVVTLFGPTHKQWAEIWHPGETQLQVAVPCGPCQQPICPVRTGECMMRIEPDAVLEALVPTLGSGPTVSSFDPAEPQ